MAHQLQQLTLWGTPLKEGMVPILLHQIDIALSDTTTSQLHTHGGGQ